MSYVLLYPYSHHYTFFFFNDTATTEIYTLSLHDALPIYYTFLNERLAKHYGIPNIYGSQFRRVSFADDPKRQRGALLRSEEHTSELQSRLHLVCRLLLEKKK